MHFTISLTVLSSLVTTWVAGQTLSDLMRSDVAGYGGSGSGGGDSVKSPNRRPAPVQNSLNRPPPPPAPPVPPMENQRGSFDGAPPEPAFGPPNMPGMGGGYGGFGMNGGQQQSGLPGILGGGGVDFSSGPPSVMPGGGGGFGTGPGMPQADGMSQMPSLSMSMFQSVPGSNSGGGAPSFSFPQFGNQQQNVPAGRNDQPSLYGAVGQDTNYAYPAPVPSFAMPQQQSYPGAPQTAPVLGQGGPQQLMLGGFPYKSPVSSRNQPSSFIPPVAPQPSGDYAYDWTYKSPNIAERPTNQLFGSAGNKDEVLSVRDLLAPQQQPTMPPVPTTAAPPVKRCIPDDFPETKGLCASRENRRSRCGGMISSVSSDCYENELCCYRIEKNSTRSAALQTDAKRTCKAPIPSVGAGFCSLHGEREKRCSGLLASPSTECANNEVCCFTPLQSRAIVPVIVTTADLAPATLQAIEIPCAPSIRPTVQGFCTKRVTRSRRCQGMLLSGSDNCHDDELCCFFLNATATRQAVIPQTTSGSYGYGYVATTLPTTQRQTTLASYGLGSATSPTASWNQGAATVPYYLPYTPQNLCVPATDSNVYDGVCVAGSMIQYLCTGLQAASSLNCASTEYCCYANKAPVKPYSSGCIPDNNPNIANGYCTNATDLAAKCTGISISTSRYCAATQYCCYSNSIIVPSTTIGPEVGGGTTATSSYYSGSNVGTGKACRPQGNQLISNGSCVAFAQVSQQCKGVQISPSLDCGVSEYCCYVSSPVVQLPAASGCSPYTNPSVSNGTCVDSTQLAMVCRGSQIATSKNCLPTQFCCFGGSASTPVPTTTSTATTVRSTTITTVATTTAAAPTCSPDNNPVNGLKYGRCYDNGQLATACKGSLISTSADCPAYQLCCYTEVPTLTTTTQPTVATTVSTTSAATLAPITSGTTSSTTSTSTQLASATTQYPYRQYPVGPVYVPQPPQMANRTCSPQSNRQIQNGICVSSMKISQQCRGIQISPSLDCTGDEYCCYQGPEVMDLRPGGACIPQANPKILNGVCVDSDQLSVSCRGVSMSTSRNCRPDQFCCFNTNDAYAWGWASKTVETQRMKRPEGSCRSNRQRESGPNGICVDLADVMVACQRWQVARSDDCRSAQYCCFSPDDDNSTSTDNKFALNEISPTRNRFGNRDTMLLAMAAQQAPYIVPQLPSTPQPYVYVTNSPTRPPYTIPVTSPVPSRSCRPLSYPTLNSGICVANNQIGTACAGIQVSPSQNCYSTELCCFTVPVESTTPAPVLTTTVASTTKTNPTTYTSTTTSTTTPMTTSGYASTSPVTTSTATRSTSTSGYNMAPGSSIPYCIPDSLPIVNNGKCVMQEDLSSQCGGIQISTSTNCETGQFCCFSIAGLQPTTMLQTPSTSSTTSASTMPSTTTTASTYRSTTTSTVPSTTTTYSTISTISPTTTITSTLKSTLSTSTTPSTTSTVMSSNRTCVPENSVIIGTVQGRCTAQGAISTVCDGLQISSSIDCLSDEYCCYTPRSVVEYPPVSFPGFCIPDSAPSVLDGLCVANADLTKLCAGRDMSHSSNCDVTQQCCFSYGSGSSSTTSTTVVPSTTTRPTSTSTTKATSPMTTKATTVSSTTTPKTTTTVGSKHCAPANVQGSQQGTCVLTSMLSQDCNNLQISSSLDCAQTEYCCYNPATPSSTASTTGYTGAGRDDGVQLPVASDDSQSSGSVVGPQVPLNWPRFL